MPAFAGLGAPYWDSDARGAVVGLTRGAGRAHFARAALEAIAYQSRDIADAMNRESDVALSELRVDGGASRNDFLMQFQADLLGVSVDRPELVETTAAGSAYLAGLATGVWNSPADLEEARRSERRFEPRLALSPGADPASAFRAIAAQAGQHLAPGGRIALGDPLDVGQQPALARAGGSDQQNIGFG